MPRNLDVQQRLGRWLSASPSDHAAVLVALKDVRRAKGAFRN
jgi:hypothetical protein